MTKDDKPGRKPFRSSGYKDRPGSAPGRPRREDGKPASAGYRDKPAGDSVRVKPRDGKPARPDGEKRYGKGPRPDGENRPRGPRPDGEKRFDRGPRSDGEKRFERGPRPDGEKRFDRGPRRDRDDRPPRGPREGFDRNERERSASAPEAAEEEERPERIAKRLARAGIASRREAEALIADGRVTVNGKVLSSPALNVTASDKVMIDGKPLPEIERTRLWLYHKPGGLVTSNRDPEGRPTVFENLPEELPRVISVGRLDINTEGLLLLTNDGGLARVLELPETGWLRRYRVRAHGKVTQQRLDELKNGIAVEGVFYGAIEARIEREQGSNIWLEIGLREGKNREIKNVLGALGLEVTRLIRISYGPFQLGDLPEGAVMEVKGKTLRDQLGERLVEASNANFEAPIVNVFPNRPVRADRRDEEQPAKPRKRGDWVSGSAETGRPRPKRKGFEKPDERRERMRDGWSTSLPKKEGPARGKPSGSKPAGARPGGGARGRDDQAAEARPERTTRGANVWMAPGARPEGGRKAKPNNTNRKPSSRDGAPRGGPRKPGGRKD